MASILTIEQIGAEFAREFAPFVSKFSRFTIDTSSLKGSTNDKTSAAGVYVWWNPQFGVIKVGRSLDNSLKRAQEHIRDNTKGGNPEYQMQAIAADTSAKLLLFNIANEADLHWAVALEVFFERKLHPHILSGRIG